MKTCPRILSLIAIATAVLIGATPAAADMRVLDVTYHNVASSFVPTPGDPTSGVLTTFGVGTADGLGFNSYGFVTRLVDPMGTAGFIDFMNHPTSSAAFLMTQTLTNITATSATVTSGQLSVTDHDGTTLTTDVAGLWTPVPTGAQFEGSLTAIAFGGNADGTFDGSSFGSFSTDFSEYETLLGGVLEFTGSGLFDGNGLTNAPTLVIGQIIPAPGALLLGAIGVGLVGWLRRRFA